MPNKRIQQKQRMAEATAQIDRAQEALAFEQITLDVRDHGRHWKFSFGNKAIFHYYPATATAARNNEETTFPCTSASLAVRLAGKAKQKLLEAMQEALQPKRRKSKPKE